MAAQVAAVTGNQVTRQLIPVNPRRHPPFWHPTSATGTDCVLVASITIASTPAP